MKSKSLGNIVSLFISKKDIKKHIEQNELVVDKNGVTTDKFYAKNIQRSILICSIDGYEIAREQNIDIDYGSLGENIVVDFDISGLQLSDRIQIGEVELEITQKCTICESLAKINPKLPTLLKDDRGIFAKVIKGGTIKKGDEVIQNIVKFEKAQDVEDIRETIRDIFDLDLDISGGWGYNQQSALKIRKIESSFEQFAHTFAIIRSNVEMNIMQEEANRYSGLNVHVENQEKITKNKIDYKVVSFKITATATKQNKEFIKEYKENYGKENFDIQEHFQKRKNSEITRIIECWFDTTSMII
ncbi:MAG: MOSC domain-containing protein [Campylobacterota bacterium]|nr:MOSC domain-containing protein [Campylobacterota bacterium]